MFDHVTIRASDRQATKRFYDTVLATLGISRSESDEFPEWEDFSMAESDDDHPVTRGLHVGFIAPSREHVDAFWKAGTEAGYRSDGAPGPRPYTPEYYAAFLLDPDGNSAEAVHRDGMRDDRVIDHVTLRVSDLRASKEFYELIAPHAGLKLVRETDDRAFFFGTEGGLLSIAVDAPPSVDVHLAFPATANATVEAFHATAVGAGHRDHGAPGERPVYHPGYYGAFVLDPDGNNIEVVNHNR